MVQRVEVVIIGGGQAGLAISHFLTQQGRSHIVLEQATQVAPNWREKRWDSFTLVTPNWSVRLPGFPYVGHDPDGFMSRIEIVAHFDQYATSFGAPIIFGQRVTAVERTSEGDYLVSTVDGGTYAAANVVVATGSYQFPQHTPLSQEIPRGIVQLHSSDYRNPDALTTGAVLVVGSADTGCQIAEELNESGRQVYLCVGRAVRVPRRYRGKDVVAWASVLGKFNQITDHVIDPGARFASNPQASGKNGGHTLSLHQFAQNGVVLLGRLLAVQGGTIVLASDLSENIARADDASDGLKNEVDAFVRQNHLDVPEAELDPIDACRSDVWTKSPATLDLRAVGITAVIWANGYGFDYSWVHLPVLDSWGFPIQQRGVTTFQGLYFLGMNRLYDRKSGILFGVGEDAGHIAGHIANARG